MARAAALLATFGLTAGLQLVLGRIVVEAGTPATVLALWLTLGTGALLASGGLYRVEAPIVRYAVVMGALGVALPRVLTYLLAPVLGNGATSVFYTLSPLFTAALAHGTGLQRMDPKAALGLGVGVLGALLVTVPHASELALSATLALGLALPLALAVGNIHRQRHWPEGASARELGALSNLAAAAWLIGPSLWASGSLLPVAEPRLILAMAAASVLGALGTLAMWRLQQVAGAVVLSQAGLWLAAASMALGALFFGEQHGPAAVAGGLLVIAGQGLVHPSTSTRS